MRNDNYLIIDFEKKLKMINKEQEEKLKKFIELFKGYSKTKDFEEDMIDRKEREYFFSRLNWKTAGELDEFLFGEMISKLWASQIWSNKDYLIKKIISQNNFEDLKLELWNLLFADSDISQRYDTFIEEIKGLGPSSITELLCFTNPKEYGIWNDKARKALKILKFERELPLNKYKIMGIEYKKFNEILKQIAIKLKANGFKDVDLLFVDYFLYEVWRKGDIKEKEKIEREEGFVFDHDETRDHIKEIGEALGFDTETEKKIAHGSVVDVVWKAKIANLGVVMYVFEVQKGGSPDSIVINLQKARNNQSVQKLIVVSDNNQIDKIKKEIEEISKDLNKSFSFWNVKDVENTYQKLTEVVRSIDKLDLVKDEFEIEKS